MAILSSQTALKKQLLTLQHQAVRDLAWCCFSAPLMLALPDVETLIFPRPQYNLWQWLEEIDRDPTLLFELLAERKTSRLGLYYEALWCFYFTQRAEWELLGYNQQVNHDGITLGAFDFLCRHGDEFFHIETAVKFYLRLADAIPAGTDWNNWVGPNNRDRLDIKLQHLQQHQLVLGSTPLGKMHLENLFPTVKKWRSALCLQGYLFYADENQRIAKCSNPDHGKGYWYYAQSFLMYLTAMQEQYWLVLERHCWLSPAQTCDSEALLTNKNMRTHIELQVIEMERPLLIAAMKKSGRVWQETARFFIQPSTWPDSYS